MSRTPDQIVSEQLGALTLQVALATSRAEKAEEKVGELAAKMSVLEAQLSTAKAGIDSPPNGPTPEAPEDREDREAPEVP